MAIKIVATNRKAYRNFNITQTWEAGMALKGAEVKSIRDGHVNFKDSYAMVEQDEVFLYNMYINPYKQASYMNLEPDRRRKLLLHKREIKKMDAAVREKGLTLVPTKIYFSRGYAKVELALGRGKRQYDKREDVKKRTIKMALRRAVKIRKR